MMSEFEVLGIEPTTDQRKIKKAYAQLVKKYHPEEHPQEWKRIHDAYMTAMGQTKEQWQPQEFSEEHDTYAEEKIKLELKQPAKREKPADKNRTFQTKEEILENHLKQMEEKKAAHEKPEEDTELDTTFEHLDEMTEKAKEEEQNEKQRQLQKAMQEVSDLCTTETPYMDLWRLLFQREDYQWAIHQGEFLYYLADKLDECKLNRELISFLREQVAEIEKYNISVNEVPQKRGLQDPYQQVLTKLRENALRMKPLKKYWRWKVGTSAAVFLILTLASLVGKGRTRSDLPVSTDTFVSQTSTDASDSQSSVTTFVPRSSTEAVFEVLNMLDDEHQQALVQKSEMLADGIYILGDLKEFADTVSEGSGYAFEKVIPESWVYMGDDFINLPTGSYAFVIYANQEKNVILWCDPEVLVGQKNAEFYYYNGTEYQKYMTGNEKEETMNSDGRFLHEVQNGQMFYIETSSQSGGEQYPILVVPVE